MDLLTVIQARTGSTRLPGKVLLELGGHMILEHVVRRLTMCEQDLGEIIVATGAHDYDDPVSDIARGLGLNCFRGAEHDVLHRFHMAALEHEADLILRVTADCPLLDPALVDQLVENQSGDITRIAGAPKGLGEEELITADTLHRLWKHATSSDDREHVTTFADRHSGYRIRYLDAPDLLFDHRDRRLVLDTTDDWEQLTAMYAASDGGLFSMSSREILETLAATV